MKEAMRMLDKATCPNKEGKQKMLRDRIAIIERFVSARESFANNDPNAMVQICSQLIDQPGVEEAIRLGDVFAQLVEYFYNQRQMQQAYTFLEKMRKKNIIVTPYLDQEMVENIQQAMGIKEQGKKSANIDGIDEDIHEEF